MIRESTETEKETEARTFLKKKEGDAVAGRPVLPPVDRIHYEEAAADLRTHYETTVDRDLYEAEKRLKHLDGFFRTRRISAIRPADVARYIAARQAMLFRGRRVQTGPSTGSWPSWDECSSSPTKMANCSGCRSFAN